MVLPIEHLVDLNSISAVKMLNLFLRNGISMKKTGFLLLLAVIAITWDSCSTGSGKGSGGDAGIAFDTISHDFGEIPFSEEAGFEFIFTNSGTVPLLVTHVKSTCGCTIPTWSKEPVKAGKRGSIRVSYDTYRVGAFTKSIYVYSNAVNGVQRLTITGKVKSADI